MSAEVFLTDVFHGFTQSTQENAGIMPLLSDDSFFRNPFQLIIRPTIRRYAYNLETDNTVK
jgi:hypothetical protein